MSRALAILGAISEAPHGGSGGSDLPAWIEALSTLAAFLAASLAVYFAYQAFQLQSAQQQQLERYKRAGQAARVAAWFASDDEQHNVVVRNASDLPVTQVRVSVFVWAKVVNTYGIGTVPPTDEPRAYPYSRRAP